MAWRVLGPIGQGVWHYLFQGHFNAPWLSHVRLETNTDHPSCQAPHIPAFLPATRLHARHWHGGYSPGQAQRLDIGAFPGPPGPRCARLHPAKLRNPSAWHRYRQGSAHHLVPSLSAESTSKGAEGNTGAWQLRGISREAPRASALSLPNPGLTDLTDQAGPSPGVASGQDTPVVLWCCAAG